MSIILASILCLQGAIDPNPLSKLIGDTGPKAVLTGPSQKNAGQVAKIKAVGSVGTKYKFDCVPKNEDWEVVKYENGDLGIIFETEKPGTYTFALAMANDKGDISLAQHQILIGPAPPAPPPPTPPTPKPPVPPPPAPAGPFPVEVMKKLKDAYQIDLAAGVGTAERRAELSKIYRNAGKITAFDKALTKPQQIWDTMHAVADANAALKGSLPNLRQAMADEQKVQLKVILPQGVSTVLTDTVRTSVSLMLTKIADAIDLLDPIPQEEPSIQREFY